jgi:hypothetical protein
VPNVRKRAIGKRILYRKLCHNQPDTIVAISSRAPSAAQAIDVSGELPMGWGHKGKKRDPKIVERRRSYALERAGFYRF